MIPIPESVTVARNRASEKMLLEKARAWVTKDERSPGWHASGMLDPRQAFWSQVDPKELNDKLTVMFLVGKVLHAFVLGAVDGPDSVDINRTDDGSSTSTELGISYSPDKVLNGVVRELKTSRSYYEPTDVKDLDIYIEQLLVYMAATRTHESELWVLYLNLKDASGKTIPQFLSFTVKVSELDLERVIAHIRTVRDDLDVAVASQDWRRLELCRPWKCGASNCEWYSKCQPEGRYGDPKFDAKDLSKIGVSKTKKAK